jgi:hypothetical protein
MFRFLVFLDEFPQGLGNGHFVGLVLLGLRTETVSCGRIRNLNNFHVVEALRGTSSENRVSPLSSARDNLSDILAWLRRGST